jgi:hypothetical protein
MNRIRTVLLCVLALAAALLGGEAIRAASTVGWELTRTGLPANGIVRDVAFADVNLDGKAELVAAFTGAPGLVVYGRDAGVWSSAGLTVGLPSSGSYERLAVGDIFGNGKLDIFASRPAGLIVWRGDGTGSWTSISTGLPATGAYRGVALGDADSDGKAELFAAGPASGGIQVFHYGTVDYFVPAPPVTTTGTYNEVAVAYVDRDMSLQGYLDVAATRDNTGVYFWKGGAGATWTLARTGLPTTATYRGLALGDLDNDTWSELVTSRAGFSPNGGLFIYDWNDASSAWSLAAGQISTTASYGRIELHDINNDGWLDVVAAGYPTEGGQGIAAWLGGPFGFTATASPAVTSSLGSLSLADFDLDGLTDVAAGDSSNGGVLAWRGSGITQSLGAWIEIRSPRQTGSPISLGVGDLNRDGHLDVVIPTSTVGLEGFLGDGGNTWSGCPTLSKNAPAGAYGDILMDVFPQVTQDASIIAARTDGGGMVFVTLASCAGGLTWMPITTTGSYRGLSAGDIFHDGSLSLVAAPSVAKAGLRLWQYGGSGWGSASSLAISATIEDTALGDVDHDGKLEIATASSGGAGISVYDYSGATWVRDILTATGEYFAVSIGDVNNDGDLDIVGAKNGKAYGIDVWIGAGDGHGRPVLRSGSGGLQP